MQATKNRSMDYDKSVVFNDLSQSNPGVDSILSLGRPVPVTWSHCLSAFLPHVERCPPMIIDKRACLFETEPCEEPMQSAPGRRQQRSWENDSHVVLRENFMTFRPIIRPNLRKAI